MKRRSLAANSGTDYRRSRPSGGGPEDTVPNLADNLVVSADRAVPYKEVIKAMDAVRLDVSGQPLFPNVTLATVVNK